MGHCAGEQRWLQDRTGQRRQLSHRRGVHDRLPLLSVCEQSAEVTRQRKERDSECYLDMRTGYHSNKKLERFPSGANETCDVSAGAQVKILLHTWPAENSWKLTLGASVISMI